MCCGRAGTRSMPRSRPCSCRSWPSRRSPARAPVASWSCTPARSRTCSTSSSPLPVSASTGREPAELVPVDVRFSEDAVQRFNVGPASCGAYGTTLGLAETLERFGSARLGDLTAAPARAAREGIEVVPMQAFLFEVLRPILTLTPECAAIYAPEGRLLEEGDTDSAPRARRPARPARRRGSRVPLQRRRGRRGERLGARARRHAEPRRPELVRGDRARAGPGDLPGPRGDHESAALVRRDPDRGRARDPRATGAAARPVRDRRGDRVHQPRPRRGVPRGPGHRGLPGALPRQEGARLRGHRRALAAWATRPTSP